MKHFRIFLLTIVAITTFGLSDSYSQKMRKEEIYDKGQGVNKHVLYANLFLDDNNNVTSREVVLGGQDTRYSRAISILISYKGSPKELYTFMNKLDKFYNENKADTYDTIDGRKIRRAKYGIGISDAERSGEVGYDIKSWGKIKEALVEWAKKNNEPLE